MAIRITSTILALLAASCWADIAWSQNPYGGGQNTGSQRRLPTFSAGSNQSPPPPTGNYTGQSNALGRSQLSQTYPPAPRVRRPVISPYLNLNRPEGIVGGVPNYYSLVRPEVNAFDRYKQGVENFRQFQQDNARTQQELYMQQQQDYEALNERIRQEQAANSAGSTRTQYGQSTLRATGHQTSFGVR